MNLNTLILLLVGVGCVILFVAWIVVKRTLLPKEANSGDEAEFPEAQTKLRQIEKSLSPINRSKDLDSILAQFRMIFEQIELLKKIETTSSTIGKTELRCRNEKETIVREFVLREAGRVIEEAESDSVAGERIEKLETALRLLHRGRSELADPSNLAAIDTLRDEIEGLIKRFRTKRPDADVVPEPDTTERLSEKIVCGAVVYADEYRKQVESHKKRKLADNEARAIFLEFVSLSYSFTLDEASSIYSSTFLNDLEHDLMPRLAEKTIESLDRNFRFKTDKEGGATAALLTKKLYDDFQSYREFMKKDAGSGNPEWTETLVGFGTKLARITGKADDRYAESIGFFLGREIRDAALFEGFPTGRHGDS